MAAISDKIFGEEKKKKERNASAESHSPSAFRKRLVVRKMDYISMSHIDGAKKKKLAVEKVQPRFAAK